MELKARLQELVSRARTHRALASLCLALVTWAGLVFMLTMGELPTSSFEVGRPAPRDVKASSSVEVINEERTEADRRKAIEQVRQIESFNPFAQTVSEGKVVDTFRGLAELARLKAQKTPESQWLPVEEQLPLTLSLETRAVLLKASPSTQAQLQKTTLHLISETMRGGVRETELAQARARIAEQAGALAFLSPAHRQAVAELASGALLVNRFPDEPATRRARQQAAESVKPSKRVVVAGEMVAREGDLVTPETLRVLEAMGFYRPQLSAAGFVGYGLLALVMVSIVTVYLRLHCQALHDQPRLLWLLALTVLSVAGVSSYLTSLSPYLAPAATAGVLIAILLEVRLALLVIALLALFIGVDTGHLQASGVALLTGLSGVLAAARVSRRWDLISASLIVWAVNVLSVLVFSLLGNEGLDDLLRDTLFFGGLNGLTSALVAVGALPLLENFFGITTHIKLLELSNPNEPILHRLLTEAPGTYQHSVMVANLAEGAAQAIGADALLVRVGAYYHDIGKIRRPRFFVENQVGHENPHDKLNPSLSSLIITSHVKDGLDLARQVRLPEILTRFIAEHHGTSLVSYFYHQARSRSSEPISEDDFRYPGPKPQSRETALLMLCDGIEAASRTLPSPTRETLSELVDKMIRAGMEDGQFDECDLSMKDLKRIREALIRILTSHYHARIEYPEPDHLQQGRRGAKVTRLVKKA